MARKGSKHRKAAKKRKLAAEAHRNGGVKADGLDHAPAQSATPLLIGPKLQPQRQFKSQRPQQVNGPSNTIVAV